MNEPDRHGQTPLFMECLYSREEIVQTLFWVPTFNVNAQSSHEVKVKSCPCRQRGNFWGAVKLLLQALCIVVKTQGTLGLTPLRVATVKGSKVLQDSWTIQIENPAYQETDTG